MKIIISSGEALCWGDRDLAFQVDMDQGDDMIFPLNAVEESIVRIFMGIWSREAFTGAAK